MDTVLHPQTIALAQGMGLLAGPGGDPTARVLATYATVGSVHINVPMQNLILGYQFPESMFLADTLLPPLPVTNESDLFYKMDRSPMQRNIVNTLVPDRAPAREIDWTWTTDVYQAQRYALATSISDRERRNADNQLQLEEASNLLVVQLLKLDQEIRAAALLSKTNTSGVTLTGANQFNDPTFTASGISIEKQVDTAKAAVRRATGGFNPNHIVIPDDVAKAIKRDPTIRDLIKYTTNALVNGDLPDTLWGMQVHIPTSQYTTSPEGTAEASVSYADIWGSDTIRVMYVNPMAPNSRTPTTGYQFRVTSDNYAVYNWREERRHMDLYEVGLTQDMKLVVPAACYVIEDALA